MKFIFCSEPFSSHLPDFVYEKEAEACLKTGFEYELFSFEDLNAEKPAGAFKRIKPCEKPTSAIYRGWMLKPERYETLYSELAAKNLFLINSPAEYLFCHYFPESYSIIENHTPKSVFFDYDENFNLAELSEKLSVFGNKPLILKDFVKSRKHEWNEACFIETASNRAKVEKVVERFLELQGADLNKGLVFREFVELQPLTTHSKSGMPLTKEFRLFFLFGKPILATEYWDEGVYEKVDLPINSFTEIAAKVKSNFFTMDVAQKTDGTWTIIELGDGQVAGLPDNVNVTDFYQTFK